MRSRTEIFDKIDQHTQDSRGNRLDFGRTYVYQSKLNPDRKGVVEAIGLDLRTQGWAACWIMGGMNGETGYVFLPAGELTPLNPKDGE